MTLTRRSMLGGLAGLLAAPSIVRAASIMPVKTLPVHLDRKALAAVPGGLVDLGVVDFAQAVYLHRHRLTHRMKLIPYRRIASITNSFVIRGEETGPVIRLSDPPGVTPFVVSMSPNRTVFIDAPEEKRG